MDNAVKFDKDVSRVFLNSISDDSVNIKRYQRALDCLLEMIGDACQIQEDTGLEFRNWMINKHDWKPQTVLFRMNVYNLLVSYLDHPEWVVKLDQMEYSKGKKEINREEYGILLQQAKKENNHMAYLFLRLMGSAGLRSQEILDMTVDDVRRGYIVRTRWSKVPTKIYIPSCLIRELHLWIEERGLTDYLFLSTKGTPILGQSLNDKISRIGKSVHIECSGLSILRYYDRRRASIQNMLIPELESRYDEELAKEQMAYGWEAR